MPPLSGERDHAPVSFRITLRWQSKTVCQSLSITRWTLWNEDFHSNRISRPVCWRRWWWRRWRELACHEILISNRLFSSTYPSWTGKKRIKQNITQCGCSREHRGGKTLLADAVTNKGVDRYSAESKNRAEKKTIRYFVSTVCHCSRVSILHLHSLVIKDWMVFDSKRADVIVGHRFTFNTQF